MCIFCKIANKEIPSSVVYEDDQILAFLDLAQLTFGHTLVILKEHSTSLLDTSDQNIAVLFSGVKKVMRILENKLGCSSFQILNNTGITQDVKHLHVHIIPIYEKEDSIAKERTSNIDIQQVAKKLL